MARSSSRAERIAEQMRRELAQVLRDELKDPRVSALLTLTGVELTKDLSHARVLFTVLGEEEAVAMTAHGLKNATGFLRAQLGQRMRLRVVPTLSFEFDESVREGVRLSRLIDEANAAGSVDGDGTNRQ